MASRIATVTVYCLTLITIVSPSFASGSLELSPGWNLALPLYGGPSGETKIEVTLPRAGNHQPLVFGIPVGQARSADEIALFDGRGRPVPASFLPLGAWNAEPAHWALVSVVLDAPADSTTRPLTVRWGNKPAPIAGPVLRTRIKGDEVTVGNPYFTLSLSPRGGKLTSQGENGKEIVSWRPSLTRSGGSAIVPSSGEVRTLYSSPKYVKIRFVSLLADSLELHQEYEVFADSPQVRCASRFINRSLRDIPLDCIVPVEFVTGGETSYHVRSGGAFSVDARSFRIAQGAFSCTGVFDGAARDIPEDASGNVTVGMGCQDGSGAMVSVPAFRRMAAGETNLASTVSGDGDTLRFRHYEHIAPGADVRLRGTMARTFSWTLMPDRMENFGVAAAMLDSPPTVRYDRGHLTRMGVFPEESVSRLFDAETDEGARYFLRARVPRAEYPRCGRGTEPGDDGEGLYEVNLHAGGMVAGEVFQYFVPKPDSFTLKHYGGTLGFTPEHIVTGGRFSYRNGDIPLALFQQHLRTGDPEIGAFAREHTLLFADYAVGHAWGASGGLGHYYCDWFGNPYVYQRFEGLLLGWRVTGDPWLFESAKAMADWSLGAWKDGAPCDGGMYGNLGMVQSRAAYVAKMHLAFFDATGDRAYAENAVRLADWAARTREPEGWWVMDPTNTQSRAYRCTPIFTGYISQGLWPLERRTNNASLRAVLTGAADWYLARQEDARGSNPGSFPNSYWYGANGSESAPVPVSGNYATTQHAASALLEAYLATGRRDYFYGANAAWTDVLNHQTPEGGIPLENTAENSVWSHVLVESLPRFASIAERDRLPIVTTSKTGVPGTSFMGRGAAWDGRAFRFALKYKNDAPVAVRIYFPAGKPRSITIDDVATKVISWNPASRIASFLLPPSIDFRTVDVLVQR